MSNPWEIKTIEYDKTNSEGNTDIYGYGQISILLNKYVLKEKGKGLSSNDFTDSDVQKLNSIEVGAEVNKLETLTINNGSTIHPNVDKNININVPTKTSQLENDMGFAKLINTSQMEDYSDSYVGKAKYAFEDVENLAIGKNANADDGGIALGANTSTSETYDVNIANKLKHNNETDIWEGKISESQVAIKNENGTDLTELDTILFDVENEVENRINADNALQDNIDAEAQNRINGDNDLQESINAEAQNRIDGDNDLQDNINVESQRITDIEDLIPNQASTSNQLADKSFVNSSIQTTTANFRGSWGTWGDVPMDASLYPIDYSGNRTPTQNDYMVVQNTSDYVEGTLSGTWRFKYSGNWDVDRKNGWLPEYQVNEEPLTSEQIYALNSGITCDKVNCYDAHVCDTSNPHSVTKQQIGLGNVGNFKAVSTVAYQGLDNDEKSNARNNIDAGTVNSVSVYNDDTLVCEITNCGDICLGANAFNSTPFTTCVGTVTSVNVSINGCSGTAVSTSGTITLTDVPSPNATCFDGCTYECAKADFRDYTPSCAEYANCACMDSSGCEFGTASRYDCDCFAPPTIDCVASDCMEPVTSNAVSCAISDLSVSCVGGSGKYISSIEQTNGKITATEETLSTCVASGDYCAVTSDAVAQAIAGAGVSAVDCVVSGCMSAVTSNAVANWTPSYATCSTCKCRVGYTTAYDFDVLLTNGISSTIVYDWVSACCRLRYCSTTGSLRITNTNGGLVGNVCTACVYTGSYVQTPTIYSLYPSANQNQNVTIYARCCNASAITTRTFVFCGSTGYLHGNVCGNLCGTACTATCATCATGAFAIIDQNGCATKFNWAGNNVNPNWVWGSNAEGTTCVYNPRCFTVKCADSATSASVAVSAGSATSATTASCASAVWYGSAVFCIWTTGTCYCLCNRCSFPAIFTPAPETDACKSVILYRFMGSLIGVGCKYCIGSCNYQIGTWNTCCAGTRVY